MRVDDRSTPHSLEALRRPLLALLAAGLVLTACSSSTGSAGPGGATTPSNGGDQSSSPTAEPSATPSPTSTPEPTPTPTPTPPPVLEATALEGSGLVEIRQGSESAPGPWGITIDGVLRAVEGPTGPATAAANRLDDTPEPAVWIPLGAHEVCIGRVDEDAEPIRWESSPTSPATLEQPSCGMVTGEVDARPELLPGNLIIAHYGTGITSGLGVLGEGSPESALQRVVDASADYADFDTPVIPAFEFIVSVAQAAGGPGNTYSAMRPAEEVLPYLELIRSVGGIVVLDFQPGRTPFLEQVELYEDLLREPDVHLALDPEWSMDPDERPGRVIGETDADVVNEVLDYVDALVERHGLPQKLVIVHQFQFRMIERRDEILPRPGIAVMFHIDGQGPVGAKYGTYGQLATVDGPYFNGFKVFFDEDSRVMTPAEVMALEPRPEYVSYQ